MHVLTFFFSPELLLALFLARGENAVKTGACVAWVCVLGAVSSGCSVAPLTVAPFFLSWKSQIFFLRLREVNFFLQKCGAG